jgi:hypothetical protein
VPLASVLTVPLELASVWLAAIGFESASRAWWTLVRGGTEREVSEAAARGAAIGFATGLPWTVVAAIALAVSSR